MSDSSAPPPWSYMAAIVESADDAIISKNIESVIMSWNAGAERLFGYTPDEAIGQPILIIIPPERVDEETMIIGKIRAGERVAHYETVRLRKDGSRVPVSLTVSPVRNAEGRIVGASKIVRDMSERVDYEERLRTSEQKLRILNESLEKVVAERTAELNLKTRKLRDMASELASAEHRERKRLAAFLHDDLQQLLAAAAMEVGTVKGQVTTVEVRESLARTAQWIREAVEAARNLTRQLRPPVLYEGGLVPALRWLAAEMKERHRLDVAIVEGSTVEPVEDDMAALLYESVRELLFNTLKHAEVDQAEVGISEEDARLRLWVSDRGAGFDAEAAAEDDDSADGFGLFSIQERIESLGGTMSIQSVPGGGTRVELVVSSDMREDPGENRDFLSVSQSAALDRDVGNGTTIRVLIVDDHAVVRAGIGNVVNSDERLVLVGEAASGLDAIDAVERLRPHVVLMDLNMPRMNGLEATDRIRRTWPDVAVIGLSVQDDEATAKAMRDAGAVGFLSKSGDTETMVATILSLAMPDRKDGAKS